MLHIYIAYAKAYATLVYSFAYATVHTVDHKLETSYRTNDFNPAPCPQWSWRLAAPLLQDERCEALGWPWSLQSSSRQGRATVGYKMLQAAVASQ